MSFDQYQIALERMIGWSFTQVPDEERQRLVAEIGTLLRTAAIKASQLNTSLDWIAEQDLKRLELDRVHG